MPQWWQNEFYSQFGEDSILFSYFRTKAYGKTRKLDDIGEGFYVDIGSHHPFMLSNTWFFYQRGWSGITVDPTPGVKKEFDDIRPRDISIEAAIAEHDGTATLFSYGRMVRNTLDASRIRAGENPTPITVEALRLSTLLDRHLPAGKAIDILSVDVEGLDLQVLKSNDWKKYRPELVVVEHHEGDISNIIASETYVFLVGEGYQLYGWSQPSLVFRRRRP